MRAWSRPTPRQQCAGSAGAPGDRAREQISSRPRRARRHHRADADQARDRARPRLHRRRRRACAIPTPISPGASNISPAPIAPPTAITAAPCVIMRAAITMPPSASGIERPLQLGRCWRACAAENRRQASNRQNPATRTLCRPPIAFVPGAAQPSQRSDAARPAAQAFRGHDSAVLALTPPPNRLH